MNETIPAPTVAPENKEITALVTQAQAPDLATITEAGGQGALIPIQPPNELVPVRPKHISDERDKEIQQQAQEFVEMVKSDPSDWKLGDYIFKLGHDIMEKTKINVSLYERKMGEVLKVVADGDSPVAQDILAIKTQLDLVNPVMVQSKEISVTEKVMRIFSKTVSRLPKGDEVIRIIAERRETVNSTINGIRVHMMLEADKITKDASELGVICDHLKELQPALQEEIYKGQLIWQHLVEYINELAGSAKESVSILTSDLAMGVIDLQTIDNSNLQTRFGGEMMIRNSRLVRRLMQRTDTILTGSVANALAVRVAAAQQMETLTHLDTIQQSIGKTMVDTSQVVGDAAVKSAEMSQQMGVNIEFLQEACNNYEQAADAYAQICNETIKIATQSSNSLNTMNERFRTRTDAMTSARQEP
ncbi:MAG: toxic anion resistance protein [Desulfobacterales bacterium]|nr:MAG: toxic anion resistance protein [Desulfobacterales bacterium]